MEDQKNTAILDHYWASGFKPVRLTADAKRAIDTEWQKRDIELEAIKEHVESGGNVGLQMGKVSDWHSCIDADCAEAVALAPRFLPQTLTAGRDGQARHYFYRSPGLGYKTFRDDHDELLAIKASDNGRGHLVVVEPSNHPKKGRYRWHGGFNPAAIAEVSAQELKKRAELLAVAALIAHHLPPTGRHELALCLSGYLLRNGEKQPHVLAVLESAWRYHNAPREAFADLQGIVRDTDQKLERGEAVKGGGMLEELIPGMRKKIAKFLGWEKVHIGELPRIVVNNRHLRDVTADALEALKVANDPPEVFVRAGALCRVQEDEHGTPQIQLMEMSHVRGRLARAADFVRVNKQDNGQTETKVNPPEVVVKDLMALGSWPVPALEAVVESPILRPDGSIFDTPGYDEQTRLYYRPVPGFVCPEIPETPSPEGIRDALDLINESIGEFPYGDRSSAANTLALMLTPLVRQAIPGPVPMALIDKPQAGTGGSLLAETIALIGTGRTAEMLGAPRDDEEWRKQITAKLAGGGTMITVDNVEGALFAPSLARALTARTWTDRVLGRSETVTVSQRATWIATGNNIILRGDLPRRCYWIRLDAKQSRPWQRENFKHPDLLSWVSEKRGKLVGALLTIARGWFAAGKPKAEELPRLGSFEAWTEIVGGMVAFTGVGGFLGNLKELYDKADEGNAEWEAFLEEWWKNRGEDPITVKALAKLINEETLLKDALPGDLSEALDKGEGSFTRKLGKALAKRTGTRYGEDGLHITEAGEQRRAKLWSVQDSSEACEFVSFVSLYNPSAGKKDSNKQDNVGGNKEKIADEEPETNSGNSQTHTHTNGKGGGGWEMEL